MKRYNLVDSAYRGRRIPLINPPLLSWRAVYKEGEWGKSCAGCFEEGGLRLDNDTHNNNSTRLSEVLHGSGLSKFHFRVLGKSGIPCVTAWLLCICTSSPATSALTLLICSNSGSQTLLKPGHPFINLLGCQFQPFFFSFYFCSKFSTWSSQCITSFHNFTGRYYIYSL